MNFVVGIYYFYEKKTSFYKSHGFLMYQIFKMKIFMKYIIYINNFKNVENAKNKFDTFYETK